MNMTWLFPVLVAGTISLPASSLADPQPGPDEVRAWVESGRIQPLEQLLARHPLPGRVLDVELESEHGTLVYEIKWLDDNGRRHKTYLDAASGEMLGRGGPRHRRDRDDNQRPGDH